MVVLEPGWKQCIHTTYKPKQVVIWLFQPQNQHFSAFIQFMKDAVPSFQADQYSSDGKLSNDTKIAAIYHFYNPHFENSCKHSALTAGLFTNLRNEVSVLIFRVHRAHIIPKVIAVINQNGFNTPFELRNVHPQAYLHQLHHSTPQNDSGKDFPAYVTSCSLHPLVKFHIIHQLSLSFLQQLHIPEILGSKVNCITVSKPSHLCVQVWLCKTDS